MTKHSSVILPFRFIAIFSLLSRFPSCWNMPVKLTEKPRMCIWLERWMTRQGNAWGHLCQQAREHIGKQWHCVCVHACVCVEEADSLYKWGTKAGYVSNTVWNGLYGKNGNKVWIFISKVEEAFICKEEAEMKFWILFDHESLQEALCVWVT